MSQKYPGGIITKSPATPTGPYETGTASGIWTLDQQLQYKQQGVWPTAGLVQPDPQFNYVTMLLHGDGTNGAQNNTFLDSSTNNFTITRNGNTTQGSFSPYGSNWSNFFADGTQGLFLPTSSNLDLSGDFTIEGWFFKNGTTDKVVLGSNYPTRNIQIAFDQANVAGSAGIYNGSSWQVVTCSSSPNSQWFHLAFVRSGTTVTVYLNGTSQGTFTSSTNYRFTDGAVAALRGYNLGGWVGYISNFRIVNGTAVYTANFTPSTTPLTAITNTSLLTCQSSRFVDNSTNNFTITPNNAPSVQRFNPFGTATAYSTSVIGGSGYFDGTGDYLSTPSTSNLSFGSGDFTIEAWVYANALGSFNGVFSQWPDNGATANNSYVLESVGSSMDFYYASGTTLYGPTTLGTITTGVWIHYAICRSGNTLYPFKNGVLGTTTSITQTLNSPSSNVTVGGQVAGAGYWNGYISNLRVVKGTAVYTAAFTPPTAPVTAISGTSLLTNFTNGAIFDNAMINDLETVGNAQISTSVVKYGTGSLYFDGTGDYLVSAPSPANILGSGDFTIELWLYPSNTSSAYRSLVASENYPNTTGGWDLYQNGTSLEFWITGPTQIINATSAITATNWQHLALCRASGTLRLFVNGTSVASVSNSTSLTGQQIWIGENNTGSPDYFYNGYIDDLRITDGYARYTTTFTPPTAAFPNTGPT